MIPLHQLLSRIQWDPEFGRGEFRLGYYDRLRREVVSVPLQEVHPEEGSRFSFRVTDVEGVVHSVPYHRVKEVWKDGVVIWRRGN